MLRKSTIICWLGFEFLEAIFQGKKQSTTMFHWLCKGTILLVGQ